MSVENEDDDNLDAEASEAEVESESEVDAEADVDAGPASAGRAEPVEFHSSETHRKLRDQLDAEIQAFLAAGGSIEQVEPNVSARPPIITASVSDDAS